MKVVPKIAFVRPKEGYFRQKCYDLAQHFYFEMAIITIISLNTITMTFKWVSMTHEEQSLVEYCNFFFTFMFLVEAVIKLLAYHTRYFKDKWNMFDFIILLTSIVFIVMSQTLEFNSFTTAISQVVRTLRIGRVFKLFRGLKILKVINSTFLNSLSSLINVGSLMFLFIFIYAVIGTNLFAEVKMKSPMHERLNFRTFPNAVVTLIRAATGEGWNDLMDALGQGYDL